MLSRNDEKKIWMPTMISVGREHGQALLGERAEAAVDPDPHDHSGDRRDRPRT